ncbi:MAG: hypothetical protein V5A68_07335 [Candidatus Thermoplasmatota archaeon]
MIGESQKYWTAADKSEHSNSVLEYWAIESFFESLEDNKKWSLNFVLLDVEKNRHFINYQKRNKKLSTKKKINRLLKN